MKPKWKDEHLGTIWIYFFSYVCASFDIARESILNTSDVSQKHITISIIHYKVLNTSWHCRFSWKIYVEISPFLRTYIGIISNHAIQLLHPKHVNLHTIHNFLCMHLREHHHRTHLHNIWICVYQSCFCFWKSNYR